MREWMSEPDDPRPVIGYCAECGEPIFGETIGYESDKYYDFDWLGVMICDQHNCLRDYCDRNFAKGD